MPTSQTDAKTERLRAAVEWAFRDHDPGDPAACTVGALKLDALIAHVAAVARRDVLLSCFDNDVSRVLYAPHFYRALADAERAVGEPSHPAP